VPQFSVVQRYDTNGEGILQQEEWKKRPARRRQPTI